MKKIGYLIIVLLFTTMYFSCQQDDFSINDNDSKQESAEQSKAIVTTLTQNQVNQKFGQKSNLSSYFNSSTIKAKGAYNNYVIDTEYINSLEEESFHSLTYQVTYPERPDLYVNFIF